MKKIFKNRILLTIILISSFLIIETIYFIRLFHAEEEIFQTQINQAISFAIEKMPYLPNHKHNDNIDCFFDHTHPGRIIITYHLHDKFYRIDTTQNVSSILKNRVHYDLSQKYWNIEQLDSCFRSTSPYPNSSIIFARKDSTGQIIDQYPHTIPLPTTPPTGIFQLGHIHPDYLFAWYQIPLFLFWERQQENLIISILPLLLFLFYTILILRKEKIRKYDNLQLEKQIIFTHDLKTPLATNYHIEERLYTSLSSQQTQQLHETLTTIHRQSSCLLTEIEQFIQQDSNQYNSTSTHELYKRLKQLISNYQYTYPHVHITFQFQIYSQEIPGDSFHILHIIENLLSNAVKHITNLANIHIKCYEDFRQHLCISVRDDGPGIPLQTKKHIFQTGFRSLHTTNSHGLGLSYVRQAVRAANGTLHLYSHQGEGTEFFIRFRPTKLNSSRLPRLSHHLYLYAPIILLIAEIIGTFHLLKTEQVKFLEHESQRIEKSIASNNAKFHGMKGTNDLYFKNNLETQTITIFRYGQDTTISMKSYSKTNNIYEKLLYDLRDSLWNLDTLYHHYYAHSNNPYDIALLRRDATGHIIDNTDTLKTTVFPLVHTTSLGFLEGHQLEIRFYTPSRNFLINHSKWLLLALIFTIASISAGFYLFHLTKHLQTFNRFQREDVQYLLHKLQPCLLVIVQQEKEWTTQPNTHIHAKLINQLPDNIARYHHALRLVNVLLNRIIAFRVQQ